MMKIVSFVLSALLTVAWCAIAGPTARPAALKITNAHLVATCLGGRPLNHSDRRWNVTAPTTLTFTMRNEPRSGVRGTAAGFAMVTFTPEGGHQYEIEVRAPALANSQRVWPRGEWAPVVRDRTTDRVVSGAPQWTESGCTP